MIGKVRSFLTSLNAAALVGIPIAAMAVATPAQATRTKINLVIIEFEVETCTKVNETQTICDYRKF